MIRRRIWTGGALLLAGFCAGWLFHEAPRSSAGMAAASQDVKPAPPPRDGKLRIIAFGAHPDDCELKAGGAAAKWAAQGHHVKFVSTTNGDIGHWKSAGGPLALRRKGEVEKAARLLGI